MVLSRAKSNPIPSTRTLVSAESSATERGLSRHGVSATGSPSDTTGSGVTVITRSPDAPGSDAGGDAGSRAGSGRGDSVAGRRAAVARSLRRLRASRSATMWSRAR
jgi:hypothetical protein